MNIPNDTGYPYRLLKYVQYHMAVPPIEPATIIPYCIKNHLSEDSCILIAWYNSMCYCSPTAILLMNLLPNPQNVDLTNFWHRHKKNLLFVSARRYVKNMDWFVPLLSQFVKDTDGKSYSAWLKSICNSNDGTKNYELLYEYLNHWQYMGRFSIELVMDMLVHMYDKNLLSIPFSSNQAEFNWNDGSNVTSGLLNMFYEDDKADQYDKTHSVPDEWIPFLNEKIKEVQQAIKYYYPEQDVGVSVITPKICSYRNLFKGRRYGGYHHDRQLEQLIHYESVYPNLPVWKEIYKIRFDCFPHKFLGELGGWKGIRKEREKLWLMEGLTGVE